MIIKSVHKSSIYAVIAYLLDLRKHYTVCSHNSSFHIDA